MVLGVAMEGDQVLVRRIEKRAEYFTYETGVECLTYDARVKRLEN